MTKHFFGALSILTLLFTLNACKDKEDLVDGFGSIEVEFDNLAGDAPLNFGATTPMPMAIPFSSASSIISLATLN
ncbi:MAG: hypothetical protein IPL65_08075 [Lewinellaceae bacterium]|nr:hypothetical protein [Lewinellaceae bacterium]